MLSRIVRRPQADAALVSPPTATALRASSARTWRYFAFITSALTLLAAEVILLTIAAYFFTFSQFQPYDDEGYFLMTFRLFGDGQLLYREIYCQYGPLLYWLYWGLWKAGVIALTHDSLRLVLIALWLTASALAAWLVGRLTGRLLLAAATLLVTFRVVARLAYEPGSPQALCVVLVVAMLLLASFLSHRARSLVMTGLGFLAGCLLVTKVNIGVFALAAFGLTLAASTPGLFARATGLVGAAVSFLAPWLLMRSHLGHAWGLSYALVVSFSLLPVLLAFRIQETSATCQARDWGFAAGGCMVAIVLSCAGIIARGTTFLDLWQGVVWQHRNYSSALSFPAEIGVSALPVTAFSVALYVLFRTWSRSERSRRWLFGIQTLAPAGFGGFTFYAAYRLEHGWLLSYALPFAWLALPRRTDSSRAFRFGRQLAVATAVLQSLSGYPVFGTQRVLATAYLVPIAGLCLGDALGALAPRAPSSFIRWSTRPVEATLVVLILIAYGCYRPEPESGRANALLYPVTGGLHYARAWPLALPGAERVHVDSERRAAAYQWVTANVAAYADGFATVPGLDSFYAWTWSNPDPALVYPAWLTLLDAERQRRAVASLAGRPGACGVRASPILVGWLSSLAGGRSPLARYLDAEYRTVAGFGDYEFLVRKERPDPELLCCARPQQPGAPYILRLPPVPGVAIGRIQVVDPGAEQVVGDTAAEYGVMMGVIVRSAEGPNAGQALDILGHPPDLSQGARLALDFPFKLYKPEGRGLVVRLYRADGSWLVSLPVID